MVESAESWLDVVSLSHLEILPEILVSAPPVGVNHADSLVPSHLMEVGVSYVVLLAVSWESSVSVWVIVVPVGLTNGPSPLGHHVFLLLFGQQVKHERLVQVEDEQDIDDSDSVLAAKRCEFPEGVAEWVFEESCDVLESSPSLGSVTWLLGFHDKLGEIAVSFLGQGTTDHVSTLVHVWVAVHESFDTQKSLSEMRLGILSIVEILSHFLK
jgi:hypothetical protein